MGIQSKKEAGRVNADRAISAPLNTPSPKICNGESARRRQMRLTKVSASKKFAKGSANMTPEYLTLVGSSAKSRAASSDQLRLREHFRASA